MDSLTPTPPHPIDVARLVEELRRRAARRAEDPALAFGAVDMPGVSRPRVAFRPELGYSSKPVVGAGITAVKKTTLRMLFHVFDAMARDTDTAVGALWGRADEAEHRIQGLRDDAIHLGARGASTEARLVHTEARLVDAEGRLVGTRAGLDSEIAAREHVQADVASLAQRLAALEETLRDLQLAPRLARLERTARTPVPAPVPAGPQVPTAPSPPPVMPQPAPLRMDYERFEDRYRPEAAVRVHQGRYADILADADRVLDIGCGRGELIAMLRERGVDAYGYEIEPDFVTLAEQRGLPVHLGDGIAHLTGVPAGSLGGVVSSHVVEHVEPGEVLRLVNGAAEALRPGGVLILETPNPESLVAGSVNFHRDLTHRRPIHPDTLAFLCESAGFTDVQVLRLSPVTAPDLLPEPPESTGDADYLTEVVRRLNGVIYGFQDYAVVARLP